jgi:hypothetical protein
MEDEFENPEAREALSKMLWDCVIQFSRNNEISYVDILKVFAEQTAFHAICIANENCYEQAVKEAAEMVENFGGCYLGKGTHGSLVDSLPPKVIATKDYNH